MGVTATGNTIILNTQSGSSAEIHLYGATVTSWKQGGKERLFVSSKSALDGSAPIRGGIPVVFPIFGPPKSDYPSEYASLKQHGFARNHNWTLDKIVMDRPEGVSVRLLAPPPPSGFSHNYKLAYVVTLAAHQLSCDIHVTNNDSKEFKFQALLHNYLAVPDSSKISMTGIDKGVQYFDKALGKTEQWGGESLTIALDPLDRVYQKVPSQEIKMDDGAGTTVTVRFKGFEDCTIWNPREESGSKIGDMEEGGWNRYVCIEPGYVRDFKILAPGEEFIGQEIITIS